MKKIGGLKTYNSNEITNSFVSVGFECLDRELFKPEKCYDALAKTGVKYARCQTGWARCEKTKGVYDFEWLDTVVNELLARGVKPWFNVGYGNPVYMQNLPNPTGVGCVPIYYGNEALNAWLAYVKALATHFCGRVTEYEIWNEPDIPDFWYPKKPSGTEYAKFVNLTAEIIKNSNPTAKTGVSVATPYCFDFIESTLENVRPEYLDFFSFHAYSTIPEFRYPQAVEYIKARLNAHGFNSTELWQGEGGYPSWAYEGHWLVKNGVTSEHAQAVWQLRRYFLDVFNGIKRSSFFQMADMWEKTYEKATEALKKPAAHGLLNGITYTPKKSYETISNLSAIFCGNVTPADYYIHADIPGGSGTELISCQTLCFNKNSLPMFAYYLPLSLNAPREINLTADVYITKNIKSPILIDPYTGEVFELNEPDNVNGLKKYRNLPLKDYPLIITKKSLFSLC